MLDDPVHFIWEINKGKDTTKEDSQVSSKVPTISKDNGDHTLVINSIRTRVDFQQAASTRA